MKENQKLERLRSLMKENGIDVYIIPTDDDHQSEYVCEYYQARKYISGFTGSAGTLVVTMDEATLFTDGRYFVQAKKQLEGTGIELMKMGVSGVPSLKEYVKSHMTEDKCLGYYAKVMDAESGMYYRSSYRVKTDNDLCGQMWEDRPALPSSKVWLLDEKYSGESAESRLKRLREKMSGQEAHYHVLASLDDIAWLYNIRANDIECNPVVLAFTAVTADSAVLFIDSAKLDDEVKKYLKGINVEISGYDEIYDYINNIPENETVLLDSTRINDALFDSMKKRLKVIDKDNPTVLMKAVKNETEIANEKAAHIKDGIAVTKFMYWLKKNVGKLNITELDAADKLEELRRMQEGYIEPSFETISAYGANAAMMHYSAATGNNAVLNNSGAILVDAGGQYYEGTTDITRTIGLGGVSDTFRKHYTAVLKGMLGLAGAKFLYGCGGLNLDILARKPLWDIGMDYRCGTGHGVGYVLNVHEGPNAFRWKSTSKKTMPCVIEPGMITTDEPGVYVEGEYGIRIENELVAKEDFANEYGQYMCFEILTAAPIDLDMVNFDELDANDKKMLEKYHQNVYEKIQYGLSEEEKEWYKESFLTKMS